MASDYRPVALAALLLGSAVVAPAVSPDQLPERIRSAQAALNRLEADYQRLRAQGMLNRAEDRDYAAYLEGLAARIAGDCLTLSRHEAGALPPDLPCTLVQAPLPTRPDRTPAEQLARLESEFDSSLGDFDQMLLQEQARIKAATPAGGSGAAGGQSGSGAGAGPGGANRDQHRSSSGAQAGTDTSTGVDFDGEAGPQPGGPGGRPGTPASSQPPDLPDGSDDDVVARQLREAAEKEQDPELRRRLWEEYRRYKQGK
jgi:hypothetical protein